MNSIRPAVDPPPVHARQASTDAVLEFDSLSSDSIAGLGMPSYGRPRCAKWVVAVCSLAFASSIGADYIWFMSNIINTKNEAVRLMRTQHGLWMGVVAGASLMLPLILALILNLLGCCFACGQKLIEGNGSGVGAAR